MNKQLIWSLSLKLLVLGSGLWGMHSSYNKGQIKACDMFLSQMVPPQFEPVCKVEGGKLLASFSSPNGPRNTYDVETGQLAE